MKKVKLPSGATLIITPSPFATAKALYKAFLKELKGVELNSDTEMSELYRDLFCIGFSSDEVESALGDCLKRCQYDAGNGAHKIDESTFEPVEARGDYWTVCIEVAKENIFPFGKSLYAEYGHICEKIRKDRT